MRRNNISSTGFNIYLLNVGERQRKQNIDLKYSCFGRVSIYRHLLLKIICNIRYAIKINMGIILIHCSMNVDAILLLYFLPIFTDKLNPIMIKY